MEIIKLNGFEYHVKKDEFVIQPHAEYNNLRIYPKVGKLERIIGLLNDLTEHVTDTDISIVGWVDGGFIPIGCSKVYKNVYIHTDDNVINSELPNNIHFNKECSNPFVIYVADDTIIDTEKYSNSYILCNRNVKTSIKEFMKFQLYNSDLILNVPVGKVNDFNKDFWYYFDENRNLKYDNLIHLCIMVKNAGPLFENVLRENLPIIDRWTILDTGSTDGTQDIIRKVLKNKKGQLYEEPFINFRESRNRCLDLAGKHCKYIIMLDDTYVVKNDLRRFLNTVRGDQFASSFSLLIKSDDSEYYSNRITMTERGHRYIYTIHEVIQFEGNKENVVIPKDAAFIDDYRADYMEKRTMDRKRYDLELLYGMVEEDPTNPRHYYYLAQTYNLLEDYENAAKWFYKRATTELTGHIQEVFDSWFELGRTYNFKLKKPWEECMKCYEEANKCDPTRPEGLYFIGIHYYLNDDKKTAFDYFKKAFALGYPIHAQFSLKPTLSFHFLPKFLCELCYFFNDYKLGIMSAERFLLNNTKDSDGYDVVVSWYNMFDKLIKIPEALNVIPKRHSKPLIVFVADGNWNPWTGKDILTKGMGGSETYIIEIARWIQATNKFNCIVFCKCSSEEEFEGVEYKHIDKYYDFITRNMIDICIVSRFSEYIPTSLHNNIENVYLVLHDLTPTGIIIPVHSKLKKILCLTDWHVEYFTKIFSQFKNRTESFYYGIDTTLFKPANKVKNSFIYSSFPNRGLLPLLQMWPEIKRVIPDATLDVFSDINGKWVNEVAKDQIDEIKKLIKNGLKGVTINGWVSKKELAAAWSRAEFWLYPCIFKETFCLTALEAAASKTLAISTPLAALNETVGNRGILIEGDPLTKEWQDKALNELVSIVNDSDKKNALIERNYEWSQTMSWKSRGEEFIKRYITDKINIKTGNMFNWTNDLPIDGNHLQKFEEALNVVNPKRILEIGTFTGTSLIEMLKLYPEAKGVAIDTWKNYDEDGNQILKSMEERGIEEIFYENIRQSGMENRVIGMKGDSVDKLCELIEHGKQFDFIYVDGSHKCLNCYVDMVLGWQLLRKGGVLAVDDVLFNYKMVEDGDHLGYPLKAKEHFMEKYDGQYKIISDSYRLFIQKL
jgi:predicted O-methyltransferase YrrM/tetratricopeptide (TPR) repeat protein